MKNKNFFIIIAGIVILVMAAFLFWNSSKENPEYVEPKSDDVEQMVSDDQGSDAVIINGPNEECPEETKVSITVTGDEIVNLYAEIARLEAELAACMEGKEPKSSAATTPTRTTKKSVTKQRQAPSKSETSSSTTSAGESSRVSSPNIAISKYEGVISGDFGRSFDGEGYIFYYVKIANTEAKLSNIQGRNTTETHLNGEFGVLGVQVGDYLIYKTKTIMTIDKLEETVQFAIYIGNHTQYKYPMWLPHEFVKLNKSLATSPGIQPNDEGGFAYVTQTNYKARGGK